MDAVTGDVVVGRPAVVRADHRVSTDDLVADLERRHDHPKLPVWVRMLRSTGVQWRPWSAPLEETTERAGVGVRSRAAYEAARDREVSAAQDALIQADLSKLHRLETALDKAANRYGPGITGAASTFSWTG
ncbi:hypothetical protein [Streptomyces griseus]|uniref:hypothetical protein n=1 Tax=Streptomyces griseus TaxID=1911 RepID=UPI00369F2F70